MSSGYVGIDKDYFVSVKEVLNITAETGALETQDRVRELPPADVVEVRHGHWVFCGIVDDIYGHGASCSICGGYTEDNGYYCSCCGARMDDALQRKTNPEAFKDGDDYE